ncbi:MAG: FAD-binding oxidoreductase [Pseudomonadota bacterium]
MTETTPYWHDAAPPEPASGQIPPARVEIAIVGAGFTGLNAARGLAEAGREVALFEAGPPGAGASTRNGGMLGWGHRITLAGLSRRHGRDRAEAILSEARRSLDYTTDLIADLPGETGYAHTGRFLGAASPRHYRDLARWAEEEAPALGMEVELIPRAEQSRHIASDLYHGGVHFTQHAAVHPALMHRALLRATRAAGARIYDHCPVETVSGTPGAWRIRHPHGVTEAGELVYAANGYTGGPKGPFRAFARRLMPIPSYIIATEPLGENRMRALIPSGANIVETRATHSYFRPSPDGTRLIYGGRASLNVLDEGRATARMRQIMLSVFPDLAGTAITHSWRGFVAFTFDGIPHTGQLEGIWYAAGYNGSGVAMAPYLGHRLAQKILGREEARTAFDPTPFRSQPFYNGTPWFLRGVEMWMKAKDRWQGVRQPRA